MRELVRVAGARIPEGVCEGVPVEGDRCDMPRPGGSFNSMASRKDGKMVLKVEEPTFTLA